MAGGAIIVLLALAGTRGDAAPAAAAVMSPAAGIPTAVTTIAPVRVPVRASGLIAIPVVGIDANALRDTYEQARGGGRVHHAMDILAPRGTPVIASVDGTIRKLFTSAGGGLTIYQFDQAEERVFYYAHLDRYADGISEGLFVRQGTVIGYVGTTGNAPPGTPHLHFSVELLPPTKEWWKGTPMNPYPLLTTPVSAPR
jgi:hypothetical protein